MLKLSRFRASASSERPAATNASDYKKAARPVDKGTRLTVKLAPGGGFAARLRP